MPATLPHTIIRTNFGSYHRVVEVYAYDPASKEVLVRLADGQIDRMSTSELEALKADLNTYADLDTALREAAHDVIE